MTEWIAVEDQLPEEGQEVVTAWLSKYKRWQYMIDEINGDGDWMGDVVGMTTNIRFWLPLDRPQPEIPYE